MTRNVPCTQELFARARQKIQANPEKYAFRNIQVAVLLRRIRQRRSLDLSRHSM
jgi:hypothetical protein